MYTPVTAIEAPDMRRIFGRRLALDQNCAHDLQREPNRMDDVRRQISVPRISEINENKMKY